MDARRRLTIAVVAVVALALAGAGALALVRVFREPPVVRDATIVPAEPTEEPTHSAVPTYTVPATPATDAAPGETPRDTGAIARAPLVAYRRDGQLCIAAEDGSDERVVVRATSGPFALSPDGSALAFVEPSEGRLSIAAVESGVVRDVGPALAEVPAWSADSAWLAYTAPGPVVRRVRGNASEDERLFRGRLPAVGPDGTVVGATPAEESPGVLVWRGGNATTIATRSVVTGLACGAGTVYCGLEAVGDVGPSLVGIPFGGGATAAVVATPEAERPGVFVDLALSPSGSHLAYAEHGDDGYSRVYVRALPAGPTAGLSRRRDTYPLTWSSRGDVLLMFEGNVLQGEPVALVSAGTDGAPRRYLAEGVARW